MAFLFLLYLLEAQIMDGIVQKLCIAGSRAFEDDIFEYLFGFVIKHIQIFVRPFERIQLFDYSNEFE